MIKLILNNLTIFQIILFFRNDRNDIISDRGWEVLNNPEMMKIVNKKLGEYKESGGSGEVVVNFNE